MSERSVADMPFLEGARELDRVAQRLARAEGRREALTQRHDQLVKEVALAKARLAVRGEVERFMEEVQAEASRRNLASFEALLTALVQEVLPGEKPVALQLATERGLASLDIGVMRPDGVIEDVLEDNGGALTNVVGMALRLIAVVKAGVGRFLALDEADCWIAPERIPAFYRVLEDSAARLGVQCLVISHHDVAAFGDRLRVCRIKGEPATGVSVICPEDGSAVDEAARGFRFIRLVDVQGYKDATLTLGPGVNALIGPNNRGKSTFVRALRAVFYGEARDSLVRTGATSATVEIGVAGGRTLRFTRRPRRTPVNVWSLLEADGSIVEENGLRYETGGRAPPDWVDRLFGIVKVEDLDVHVAHQKFPVFLLGETPSRRSAVLSIGQEASYIRDMQALHRERVLRDQALVRTGEQELTDIREALNAFEALPLVAAEIAKARGLAGRIEALSRGQAALARHTSRLAAAKAALQRGRGRAAALADVPAPERLADLSARLAREQERERLARRVLSLSEALAAARRRRVIVEDVPAGLPALSDSSGARAALDRIESLTTALASARQRARAANTGMEAVRAEIARIVEATGGLCPACGASVEAEALLEHHAHAA